MKQPIGILIIITFLSGCLTDDPLNHPFREFEPQEIGDGTVLSHPSAEKMDSSSLVDIYKNAFSNDNLWSMRSLLVYRNGKLVSEAYFKDEDDITARHLIWSCTKQVMGILTGIAVEKGLIKSIDDPISKYFTSELEGHPDKANITIRNLITMQSGIDYNNDGVGGETDKLLRQIPENSVDFVLSRPMKAEPGTQFHYNDGDPNLLSALIQKVAGKPTDEWADEVFFSKIGVENLNWVRYKDGISLGGFGIETTPRELAKIALCVGGNGKWDDQQLIPDEWIEDMTNPQVDIDGDYNFGYYWWLHTMEDIHFMWGHGGQFAFVVPAKKLVVVMTSIPNTQGDYQIQADEALPIVYDLMDAAL